MLSTEIPGYFKARRDRLMKDHDGAVFIFPSHPDLIRNSDVHFPFRQDSSFFYLSGFEEADSYLVLAPCHSKPGSYRLIMFVQPRDPLKEMWEGERHGVEGAVKVFGADEAYPIQEFEKKLPEILQGSEKIFYRLGLQAERDRQMISILELYKKGTGRTGKPFPSLEDPTGPMGELRLFKGPEEIELMRKGCHISALAHRTVMKETRPGMNESEIEALIDYQFRKGGCARLGYPSIVAGGRNAACLHYRSNNDQLRDGELLLIDAGGEFGYYSADITRTFPVGRKFSKSQAQAYDLVLRSQKEGIEMARPGVTLPEIHKAVCRVLVEGFLSLGLLKGKPEEILKSGEFKRFYPHNTSHWLGMDVHDAGLYVIENEPRRLQAGMVLTIEPGFYVQPSDRETPLEYHNLGIRIEDDILITSSGCEVLSRDVPKERAEIESLKA